MDAAGDGRMVVEKKNLYWIGVGINKGIFAVVLEGLGTGLAGIGNDTVGDFQAVDVGLILLIAAEGAAERIGNETEYREKQEKRRKRGPILEAANLPSSTGPREQPADGPEAEIEKYKKQRCQERKSLPDVTERVVAHFVAKIGDDFIGRFLRDGGIPNDDALGSAEAADVGVGSDGLVAGLHPEHAFGSNFLAGAAGDALERSDELRSFYGKGLKLIEHGLDYVGRDKDDKQDNGQGENPEIEPPARRALANDGIEQPGKEAADDYGKELRLGPVCEPGRPGLDGDSVELQDPFIKNVERDFKNAESDDQERGENERLDEAVTRDSFSPVAEPCGEFAAQDEPKDEESVEETDHARGKTNTTAVAGFAIEVGRESIGGDFALRVRLSAGGDG